MALAEYQFLAQQGIELTELRLDFITRAVDVPRLLRDRPTPALVTCRRPQDGGRWRYSEDQRLTLLRTAIAQGDRKSVV